MIPSFSSEKDGKAGSSQRQIKKEKKGKYLPAITT
jgi:hypothetical protein